MTSTRNTSSPHPGERHRTRIALMMLAFLAVVAACAVGALLVKHRLEYARAWSLNAVRERTGVDFGFDALRAEGLRALRVSGLHVTGPVPGLGQIALKADSVLVGFSLLEMVRGNAVIGDVHIRGGRLLITQTPREGARRQSRRRPAPGGALALAALPPLRISGEQCQVELRTQGSSDILSMRDIAFRVFNRPEQQELGGTFAATVGEEDNTCAVQVAATYSRGERLNATLDVTHATTAQMRPYVQIPDGLHGDVSVRLELLGNPNGRLFAECSAQVHTLAIPGAPPPLETVSGEVSALLRWDADTRRITAERVELNNDYARLQATGALELGETPPRLNATAVVDRIAVDSFMPLFMSATANVPGQLDIALSEDGRIEIAATGPLTKPEMVARIQLPHGSASFRPTDKTLPAGNIRLEQVDLVWSDFSGLPTGTAQIVDGAVSASAQGLEAREMMGVLALDAGSVTLRPLRASLTGKPFSGNLRYDLAAGALEFDVNGTLTEIENTPLHDLVAKLWLGGDIAFQCAGSFAPPGRLQLSGATDLTKGRVAFEWWLDKPIGVGASIHTIEVDMKPGSHLEVTGAASIEDTRFSATLSFVPHEGKWENRHIRVDIPHLEVNSAGKCIRIPYTVVGGACRDGFYEWTHAGPEIDDSIATLGGVFDHASFLPDGGDHPLVVHDAEVAVTLTSIGEDQRSELVVHTAEAWVPPFGVDWLLPLGPEDPEYREKYPSEPHPWTYVLSADALVVPPWEGRRFSARIQSDDDGTAFDFFRAEVGEGRVEGTYRHEKDSNLTHLSATWDTIPAAYIIRHIELPEILEGAITGNIEYTVDSDDSRTTMDAVGQFTISDGHFLADEIRNVFTDTFSAALTTLHPAALRFDSITSDVRILGNVISTKDLRLQSEGMKITAKGDWVMEGDLDYRIDIAVSPDMAEQIPLLRDYFNVQGFRMTQQDIELGFHLTGPTFEPTGQLAGLPPIGVTLVSGAAEMTGEAMRFLDTPRQMFLSIFRIGGGILGATRTQQQQQPRRQRR